MSKFLSKEEAYDECVCNGYLIPTEKINNSKIKSSLFISEEKLEDAKSVILKKH